MRSIPCAILMAALAGCGEEARVAPVAPAAELAASLETSESQNAVLFPKTAHPYGASLSTWADRESQWVYGHPLEHNPLIDQTGADCAERLQRQTKLHHPGRQSHIPGNRRLREPVSVPRSQFPPRTGAVALRLPHRRCQSLYGRRQSLGGLARRPAVRGRARLPLRLSGLVLSHGRPELRRPRSLCYRIAAAGDRGWLLHDVQAAGAGRAHTPSLRHRCPGRQQDLCLSLERSVIRAAPRRSPTCTVA